ncbi:cellulase family glycosylhydrolase [Balneolaceae bacterium ANBcel3]|nr:cellulase family glycosylhydrolase [Balneolaceae bacterium ANBcel3]
MKHLFGRLTSRQVLSVFIVLVFIAWVRPVQAQETVREQLLESFDHAETLTAWLDGPGSKGISTDTTDYTEGTGSMRLEYQMDADSLTVAEGNLLTIEITADIPIFPDLSAYTGLVMDYKITEAATPEDRAYLRIAVNSGGGVWYYEPEVSLDEISEGWQEMHMPFELFEKNEEGDDPYETIPLSGIESIHIQLKTTPESVEESVSGVLFLDNMGSYFQDAGNDSIIPEDAEILFSFEDGTTRQWFADTEWSSASNERVTDVWSSYGSYSLKADFDMDGEGAEAMLEYQRGGSGMDFSGYTHLYAVVRHDDDAIVGEEGMTARIFIKTGGNWTWRNSEMVPVDASEQGTVLVWDISDVPETRNVLSIGIQFEVGADASGTTGIYLGHMAAYPPFEADPVEPPGTPNIDYVPPAGWIASGSELTSAGMKGVNNPHIWHDMNSYNALPHIAGHGFNAVRIVWQANWSYEPYMGDPERLRQIVERTLELGMFPIPELHDLTGNDSPEQLVELVDFWIQDEVVELFNDYPYMWLNIANEWGSHALQDAVWSEAYKEAITKIRDAGIDNVLVIDASGWGQNMSPIRNFGQEVLEHDPLQKIMFSIHMYGSWNNNNYIYNQLYDVRVTRDLPIVVGEFGYNYRNGDNNLGSRVDARYMMETAANLGIGYIAWSWHGNNEENAWLDMTESDWETLNYWGRMVQEGPTEPVSTTVEEETEIADEFYLSQNYPNPFNPSTTISFHLPERSDVELTVYNMLGQRVQILVQENKPGGRHTVTFDAKGHSSGVYMYRIRAGNHTSSRTMTFVK